jgi:hypothetical protein
MNKILLPCLGILLILFVVVQTYMLWEYNIMAQRIKEIKENERYLVSRDEMRTYIEQVDRTLAERAFQKQAVNYFKASEAAGAHE